MQIGTYASTYDRLLPPLLPDLDGIDTYFAPQESPATPGLRERITRTIWQGIGALALAISLLAAPGSSVVNAPFSVSVASRPSVAINQVLPSTGAPAGSQYFTATGKTVRGDFLGVFNRYGLSSIGYPLSDERQENGLTVQYFERVRMERHPELAPRGYGVLMTRLGAELGKSAGSFAAASRSTRAGAYFGETGHTLSGSFLSYWKANGGLARFGYPISEPMQQDGLSVQWFERARFEYHPELAKKGHAVQLTLLGRTAYDRAAGHAVPARQTVPAKQPPAPAVQQKQAAPKQANQPTLSGMESDLLKGVNEQRATAGLGPVQLDATLTELARSRSTDMASRNYFSHTTPEGSNFLNMLNSRSFSYKFAGEILARNNYPTDQASSTAMNSYLNSAPHKAIIMDGRYNLVGVGYARSTEDGMHYFTVLFAQR
jgi:uncharacterized protein YkwD